MLCAQHGAYTDGTQPYPDACLPPCPHLLSTHLDDTLIRGKANGLGGSIVRVACKPGTSEGGWVGGGNKLMNDGQSLEKRRWARRCTMPKVCNQAVELRPEVNMW